MHTRRTLAAISFSVLLLGAAVGASLAQDGGSQPDPDASAAASLGVAGLQLVDSTGSGDVLLGASTPAAAAVEMRLTFPDQDGALTTAAVGAIAVPPDGEVTLKADGYHLALIDAVGDLGVGDVIEVTLELETAGSILVSAAVIDIGAVLAPTPVPELPTAFRVEGMDNFFVPNTLEVPADTEIKVTFDNYGFLPHNIAFYFDETQTQLLGEKSLTSIIDPETQAIVRFTTPGPGEYFFVCTIHPEMTGTLIVR